MQELEIGQAGRTATPAPRGRSALVIAAAATILLYAAPQFRIAAWPLLLLSTFAHESGHGLAALVCGGSFESLSMWEDGSGVASYAGAGGRAARAFVAAGGLCGPALAAATLFVLARRPRTARAGLVAFGALAVVACVLVVRNTFGLFFVASLAALALVLGLRASARVAQIVLAFLALQLALSVYSRGDYLFADEALTSAGPMPSDVAQMAEALFLPYWFWGGVCGACSAFVVIYGLWSLVRGSREEPESGRSSA